MQQENPISMPKNAVAVIGAGPAGLVASRWLRANGLEPVIFEASQRLGGQWNPTCASAATWPGMRTNTSRIMTAFSDMEHAPEIPVYPRREDMLDYLERYAFTFGLLPHLRFKTRVERLKRAENGFWLVHSVNDLEARTECFAQVIVATGRQNVAEVPEIAGLESFSGSLGALHAAQYNGPDRYRGRRVVVAGCSISALEIASDIALGGAADVVSTYRRQRYILPKMIAGVPTDHVMFTRSAAFLGDVLPPEILAEGLTAKTLKIAGSPEQFGAAAPVGNVFAAGLSQSQHFLPAVAEGRIKVRPWIERIDGHTIWFEDGTTVNADALLFGTGYRLSMPWLDETIATTIGLTGHHADLHDHTFHPDLPGLAFVGLYDLVGPTFPVLELQARWIARCFAGPSSHPSRREMAAGLERCRAIRAQAPALPMHVAALTFARNLGVEPDLAAWPELERALLFGPLSPASFRLQGPHALADAATRTTSAATAFGNIKTEAFNAEEEEIRRLVGMRTLFSAA